MPQSEELSPKHALERQTFQLRVADRLRRLDDPSAIMSAAAELLRDQLLADCAIEDVADADSGSPAEGQTGLLDSLGVSAVATLRAGRTLVADGAPPLSTPSDDGTGSRVLVPLLFNGCLAAILCVQGRGARTWTPAEIALIEDVAQRASEAAQCARNTAVLRASEARYRSLFNSIDAGICVVEVRFTDHGVADDYRLLDANRAFSTCSTVQGGEAGRMPGRTRDRQQQWLDLFGRVARTGVPEQIELPSPAPDGRWYLARAFRVGAPDQHHVAVLFSDLTDRRRTQEALERSREELEAAASAADLGRYDYRPREGTLTWDDRCRALFGLSPGAPVSYDTAFVAGLHLDDRERADQAVATALDPAGPGTFEVEYRTLGIEDGILRYISAHGLAFFDQDGPIRLIGTVQDVTKDREATVALREVSERLRLAGRATNDAIWDWDFRTNHVTWNEALHAVYGYTADRVEPTGEWWLEHIHPDDRGRTSDSIHAVIDGDGTDWTDEYRFCRGDGSYADVLDRGYVIRDGEGAPVRMVGAMLDVSNRKAIERQLETERQRLLNEVEETTAERDRAEEALRQSQKMEAVGQLTGGLAHDFNNLLTGISGALEMMQLRIAQGRVTELEKYSVAAQGAVRRAAALTHRLLAFSRRQTLDPRPTDVNRLIAEVEELIRRTVGPHVEVETLGKAGLWTTLVDPNQLENALINLCINARDAMPDGGRITIKTENRLLDEQAARARDLDPGAYVLICVTDTGTGMPPDVVNRAFDPFFTTKPMGEGTGLGLSMIYGFARQSGGQVRIDTVMGVGTTMCLYLPRHAEEPDGALAIPSAASLLNRTDDRQAGCILVVDDEPTVRMLVVEIAEDLGFDVLEAFDGQSATRLLQDKPSIDLLITDVGLPGGMNGRQVADAALALQPALKVLFITGYAENAVIGNRQLAPNMALLTKPFAMDSLAARIREMMD